MTRQALLSVWDKTGLVPFAESLVALGYDLVASGGTARLLSEAGLAVTSVSDVTGFPEILGGRVKTLHPRVHGAILARGTEAHLSELQSHAIAPIEVVVCNLYPFTETIAKPGVTELDAVEQIDIGGVTLLRAAAKNFERVTVVCQPGDYDAVLQTLQPETDPTEARAARKRLAHAAFVHTTTYDSAIATWLSPDEALPETLTLTAERVQSLRYGENPHQQAAWYRWKGEKPAFELKQGKALSYNNLVDVTAAWQMPSEADAPCVAIVKHTNPCGMAIGTDPIDAFDRALACDPVSAFGSIIACNRPVDKAFIDRLGRLFVEVLVVPAITDEALALMGRKKKNCRVLVANTDKPQLANGTRVTLRSTHDGVLVQTADEGAPQDWQTATTAKADDALMTELSFAWQVVKHVKSNAIVLTREGATVGIGAGQTSRVGSVVIASEQAADKAHGAVLASDAFFPFADGVEAAAAAGVKAIIQPGGSKRDPEVIAAADRLGLVMVMTGARHFRH